MVPLDGNSGSGKYTSYAYAVSRDGSVIVGYTADPSKAGAFIWDQSHGMRNLQDVLSREFGLGQQLVGWNLGSAFSMTPDGRTIVGDGTNPTGQYENWIVHLDAVPDMAATTPTWNTTNGGVDYGYTIGNADLPQATTVDLDWAGGTTVNTVIGSPIISTTTAMAQGTYQLHATPSQLGTPPAGATYLLVVADPGNLVSPADPSKVASLALSDLALQSINWHPSTQQLWSGPNSDSPEGGSNAGGVDITYTISGADLPQAAPIALYWVDASGNKLSGAITTGDDGSDLLTKTAVNTTDQPSYQVHVPAIQLGVPPPNSTGLMVVLDPSDSSQYVAQIEVDNGSGSVNTLVASSQAILISSVHYVVSQNDIKSVFMPAEGNNPPAPDQLGQSALLISQAEALLGVTSFDWTQTITYPEGWEAYSIDLTPTDYTVMGGYAIPSLYVQGQDPRTVYPTKPLKPLGRIDVPDPVLETPGAYQSDGTLSFKVFTNSLGIFRLVWVPSSAPNQSSFVPPDGSGYYYNLGAEDDGALNTVNRDNTLAYDLSFEDDPAAAVGMYLAGQASQFQTQLAGVKAGGLPVTWIGDGSNLSWYSDAANVSNVSTFATDASSTLPPAASGGIFEVSTDLNNPNHPPDLSQIGGQKVNPGNTVSRTASATDQDTGQTLTYTLDPGSPAGATIDAKTGAFTWAVPASESPGSYPVTVRVFDNGIPILSDAKSFTITVTDVAPKVTLGSGATIIPGATLLQPDSFSSPSAGSFSATVDYGDGTGVLPLALTPSQTFTLSHAYAQPGTFTLTVDVKDPFGMVGTQTENVVVVPLASGFGAGRDAYVVTLYTEDLARKPELSGLDFWSRVLAEGVKAKTVAVAIWNSPEHGSLVKQHLAPGILFRRSYSDALFAGRQAARLHRSGSEKPST